MIWQRDNEYILVGSDGFTLLNVLYMTKFLEGGCNDTHVCAYLSLTVSQDSKYFQDP